jgi:hypothetical protein
MCRFRGCFPTKGKGLREMFRKAGYQVVLLNEHNTFLNVYIVKHSWIRNVAIENHQNPILGEKID